LGSSDFGIDLKVAYFVVGRMPTTVPFYGLNNGIKIIECGISTPPLYSHSNTDITSRPLAVRILH
jgi:hypothetical protein